MSDNDSSTEVGTTPETTAPPSGDASEKGSQATPDELSVLRSRYQGQTAKVETLATEKAKLEGELKTLRDQLAQAQTGVIDKDQALKDQIAAKDAEIANVRREAALAKIEAKYPETFAVLGEDAAGLSETKLAENEARLRGVSDSGDAPTPRGNNPSRASGTRTPDKTPSIAEVESALARMTPPWQSTQ